MQNTDHRFQIVHLNTQITANWDITLYNYNTFSWIQSSGNYGGIWSTINCLQKGDCLRSAEFKVPLNFSIYPFPSSNRTQSHWHIKALAHQYRNILTNILGNYSTEELFTNWKGSLKKTSKNSLTIILLSKTSKNRTELQQMFWNKQTYQKTRWMKVKMNADSQKNVCGMS